MEETYKAPDGRVYRARPLIPWDRLVKGGYLNRDRKIVPVVPIRFVQACVKGHISDIDWYGFVRETYTHDRAGQLWFDEGGAGNDFTEIYVRDERNDNRRRPLSDATVPGARILGTCQGRKPWLGPRVRDTCEEPNRLLTRSASNAYFSQTLSVIHIPDAEAALKEAVDTVFEDFLQYCESVEDVTRERRKQRVLTALEGHSDEVVWADIQRRKGGTPAETRGIKQAEFETLMASRDSMGEDVPGGDFYARARSLDGLPAEFEGRLDRVVLVHRLREVVAQVGFTRFESALPDIDGELSLEVELAPLARETTWLPAIENKGEGIFLSFSGDAIRRWLTRPGVRARSGRLVAGFQARVQRKPTEDAKFPGLPYLMLHSLSHLLSHRGFPGVRLLGQRHPRTSVRRGVRLRHSALHRDGRVRGHPRRAGRSRAGHRESPPARSGTWPPLLERPDLRPARPRRPARGAVPPRVRLPRLYSHRRDELRAAQRVPRPCAGATHRVVPRRGVLPRGHCLMSVLRRLGRPNIAGLATALAGGRVAPPFRRSQLRGHVPGRLLDGVLEELQDLSTCGMTPSHIARMLHLLAEERSAAQAVRDRVDLVWSGPEVLTATSRDTAVVVQELFREARESVLIASYALDTGSKAEELFGTLAGRMDAEPDLRVRLFVNIHRKQQDDTVDAVLLREFADTFQHDLWPGKRLPEIFYDPRSLAIEGKTRACLHAKCIIIDDHRALITSANFTEAAHKRNIEAGTVITDSILARDLRAQFDTLVDRRALQRVPGFHGRD